jgi:hypothetical protein
LKEELIGRFGRWMGEGRSSYGGCAGIEEAFIDSGEGGSKEGKK